MTSLELARNKIGDKGAIALVEAFHIISWVHFFNRCFFLFIVFSQLNLTDNKIGSEGKKRIANALKEKSCNLNHLELSYNYSMIMDNSTVDIASSLLHNHTLQSLYLEQCNIGDKSCSKIGEMLSQNQSLTSLSLKGID